MSKPNESKRRFFSPVDKKAVLKRHLLERVPESDLCDELGIAPNLFYRRQCELFENSQAAFRNDRKSRAAADVAQRRTQFLQDKLQKKNEVLSELLEEHVQLKRTW